MNYRTEDPAAFLEAQGWLVKRRGGQLVTTCPLCNKPEHLYMNPASGLWDCKRCGETGNLSQLRRRLGLNDGPRIQSVREALGTPSKRIPMSRVEALHQALLADQEALAYCTTTRRWSLDAVKRMKLGLRVDGRGKWLSYPWRRQGECVGMKYRILPAYVERYPARFDREPGCESVLFNADAVDQHDEIILTSGESDLMALLSVGVDNVVATTTGEASLPASAVDALSKKRRVFVPYDADAVGQKGARDVGKRLGFERTWLVRLPEGVKDVAEFVARGAAREQVEGLLAAATQFDVPSVVTLAQALDRLEEEKTIGTWDELDAMTPWPSVNHRLGRWRPGNLVVLGAPQGCGKTTWTLNVAAAWAKEGRPVLVYCLEMSVEELVQHVLCATYMLEEEQITSAVIAKARHDLVEWPLYLGSNPRATGRKEVMELLGQAVRRYGLRLVIFDNLHMLARSLEYRTEEIGVITKGFKLFAMEHEIPVALIAQPRKLDPRKVMTPWDLKDSVDIFSDADQIILLHREMVAEALDTEAVAAAGKETGTEQADNLSPITLVRIAKARHRRSSDGLLYFVGAQHRFRELEPGDMAGPPPAGAGSRHPGYRDD